VNRLLAAGLVTVLSAGLAACTSAKEPEVPLQDRAVAAAEKVALAVEAYEESHLNGVDSDALFQQAEADLSARCPEVSTLADVETTKISLPCVLALEEWAARLGEVG
jgi:hypothetical protein